MVGALTFLFALLLYLDVIKIGIGTLEPGVFFKNRPPLHFSASSPGWPKRL
jgi:hypothetical protein